jgi:methylmalonyl-CoA/ethylmalonyl-CoA epimerase
VIDLRYELDHVAVAVPDLEEAAKAYVEGLGIALGGVEVVEDQGAKVGFFDVGGPRIELVQPTGPDTPLAKFLEKRGPGLHHIALKVDDIAAALERLKGAGVRLIDEEPREGAGGKKVAFIHPKAMGGLLLELVQD